MVLTTRSPVAPALASAVSSTPYEVMAASQQAHIDELVQKNRTYEFTITKIQKALDEEKQRAVDVIKQLKAASAEERAEWREGCDSLLASHRIVHLRTMMELDKERTLVSKEKNETSKERLAVLQRDFRLTLFQAKELELENKILNLEELIESMIEENAENFSKNLQDKEDAISALNGRLAKSDASRRQAIDEFAAVEKEKETLLNELSDIRAAHATLTASAASATTKLERCTLQLEGAKTVNFELERANDELKRANADLKRQLDKWQNLETKGGAEMEDLRRRKIELEVYLKELQDRLKELEKTEKTQATALEKEKKKVERLNERVKKYSDVAEEAQGLAANSQSETTEKEQELTTLRKSLEEMRLQLEQERNLNRKLKQQKRVTQITTTRTDEDTPPVSEIEVEDALTPKARTAGESKSKTVHKPRKAEEVDRSEDESTVHSSNLRKKKAKEINEAVSENERPKKNKVDRKGKGRSVSESDEESAVSDDDAFTVSQKGRSKRQPKISKSRTDGEANALSSKGSQTSSKTNHDSQKTISGRSHNDEEQGSRGPKKKKIRIFPPSQPMTFTWDAIPQTDGGIVIPTELSPVKETDVVPRRSVFGRMGSVLGL